jgi:predicted RND superfamily exporter protein
MRDEAAEIRQESGINAMVTGTTAINIDTSDTLTAALPVFLVLVVGLALLLLAAVFRSIAVPVTAAAGFLLTIAASLGAVVWIFQEGNLADLLGVASTGPIVSFLPVLMIAILFGLAMDYEVFLVSRMREGYVHTGRAREATINGFAASARVVTAAALIMIAVFSSFIIDDGLVVKSIGFALAFGVLVDAFLVRMTLVPAVRPCSTGVRGGFHAGSTGGCRTSTSRGRRSCTSSSQPRRRRARPRQGRRGRRADRWPGTPSSPGAASPACMPSAPWSEDSRATARRFPSSAESNS